MNGAREYAALFESGQHGRLYFVSSYHARGKTFQIFVLPEGVEAIPNAGINPPLNKDAVCVYGVLDDGGQRGWTESYGWLEEGKWQNDFEALVIARRDEIEERKKAHNESIDRKRREAQNKQAELLSTY